MQTGHKNARLYTLFALLGSEIPLVAITTGVLVNVLPR